MRILSRIEMRTGCVESGDVERYADLSPSGPYALGTTPCSNSAGMWSEAGERGDLLATDGAEFG